MKRFLKIFNKDECSITTIPLEESCLLGHYCNPSISAPSQNNWETLDYIFNSSQIQYGVFSEEGKFIPKTWSFDELLSYWYCDYCGHKNLEGIGICANCYELKEED